jgi:hypothetical protein
VRAAWARSRHQPFGRDPTTLAASMSSISGPSPPLASLAVAVAGTTPAYSRPAWLGTLPFVDEMTEETAGELPEVRPAADVERLEVIGAELEGVEAALARLDDDSYGRCEVCGAAIDADLMAAEPLTRRCAGH